MIHVHKKECQSTQDLAAQLVKEVDENVLVSCEKQTKAFGRRGREWVSADQCLALSFSARPSDIYTLTSLEIAVLAKRFIQEEFKKEVFFKWPNDLYTADRKKCAGILIQGQESRLLIGIGLNIHMSSKVIPEPLKQKASSLFQEKAVLDIKETSFKFYRFIMDNRLSSKRIRDLWLESCLHLNEKARILEGEESIEGIFAGIGDAGQCLLKTEKGMMRFISAGLLIDP